jgi:hypothetical protein
LPFVAKQDDSQFGFLNINIDGKTLKWTFFANDKESESEFPRYHYVTYSDNILIDQFTISKVDKPNNNKFEKFVGLPR